MYNTISQLGEVMILAHTVFVSQHRCLVLRLARVIIVLYFNWFSSGLRASKHTYALIWVLLMHFYYLLLDLSSFFYIAAVSYIYLDFSLCLLFHSIGQRCLLGIFSGTHSYFYIFPWQVHILVEGTKFKVSRSVENTFGLALATLAFSESLFYGHLLFSDFGLVL